MASWHRVPHDFHEKASYSPIAPPKFVPYYVQMTVSSSYCGYPDAEADEGTCPSIDGVAPKIAYTKVYPATASVSHSLAEELMTRMLSY